MGSQGLVWTPWKWNTFHHTRSATSMMMCLSWSSFLACFHWCNWEVQLRSEVITFFHAFPLQRTRELNWSWKAVWKMGFLYNILIFIHNLWRKGPWFHQELKVFRNAVFIRDQEHCVLQQYLIRQIFRWSYTVTCIPCWGLLGCLCRDFCRLGFYCQGAIWS